MCILPIPKIKGALTLFVYQFYQPIVIIVMSCDAKSVTKLFCYIKGLGLQKNFKEFPRKHFSSKSIKKVLASGMILRRRFIVAIF